MTDEGRKTLSMAKSLLEALIEMLSNASITMEILVLLQNSKQKFIELVKTTTPVVNEGDGQKVVTKEIIEQILTERIEEAKEFHAVKGRVLSFTWMCDLIPPGEYSLHLSLQSAVPMYETYIYLGMNVYSLLLYERLFLLIYI